MLLLGDFQGSSQPFHALRQPGFGKKRNIEIFEKKRNENFKICKPTNQSREVDPDLSRSRIDIAFRIFFLSPPRRKTHILERNPCFHHL